MKEYVITVVSKSSDNDRIKKYLIENGITIAHESDSLGDVYINNNIHFKVKKKTWKKIKRELNLKVYSVYTTLKEPETPVVHYFNPYLNANKDI